MTGVNALPPNRMTGAERLDEIAAILAAGLVRLRAKQSSQLYAGHAESSLPSGAEESVYRTHRNGEFR
ncbi:hypothetical protein [Mesorhizobium sp. IMUNJ 23232]|uniref:hypothetical protein n=1 Tax=Mesorhizobium sp. IMUNJ 23232 TaxID=3376064 RepID=UPI003799A16E